MPNDPAAPSRPATTDVAGRGWEAHAACVGKTALFFASPAERPERRARREALAREICARCPVVDPCREQARQNRESGFWGGESEEQRAAAGFPPLVINRRGVRGATDRRPQAIQDRTAG